IAEFFPLLCERLPSDAVDLALAWYEEMGPELMAKGLCSPAFLASLQQRRDKVRTVLEKTLQTRAFWTGADVALSALVNSPEVVRRYGPDSAPRDEEWGVL